MPRLRGNQLTQNGSWPKVRYNQPATPEQNARYRQGLCVDCGLVRHSAGRPRCNECHAEAIL